MIRKPNRARLTADVALLLSSGMRLLVRHERTRQLGGAPCHPFGGTGIGRSGAA